MQVVSQLADVGMPAPAVLTIGFFDGVHRGHQALVRRTAERAAEAGGRAVLVTCWPHPRTLLGPVEPPQLLTVQEEKLERLRALGALDLAVVAPLADDLARLSPDAFLQRLRDRFDLRGLIVGADIAFGCAGGDAAWLRRIGQSAGFPVDILEVDVGGLRVSSARIRDLVAAGGVEPAAHLLGYTYSLAGTVVEGDKRGRALGYPTANLWLDSAKLLPANGIYAVRVRLEGDARAGRMGAASVGVRPTFGEGNARLVEVHVLDADLDLYGQRLEAEFVAWLRPELRFSDVEALKAQMRADIERTRALLAARGRT
jgi:riboflavin kinase / FMN adenylyltransferase